MKNINEALDYEIKSHWLASYISFGWGQEIMAWWIANKVKRKWKRYLWVENTSKTNEWKNWNDVKKELPTEWGDYLVMADEMDVMTFYPDAPDLWSSWQARGHKSGGNVTHWMKLPNKPQTE